jgi:AraC-like DNA-binding protein
MDMSLSLGKGQLRVAALMALPKLMEALGGSLTPILRELHISSALLQHPENCIPMVTVGRMLERAAQQLHCEHLGLLLGHYSGVSQLGPVGQLMGMMPTVGQALQAAQQMLHLHDRAAVVTLRQMDGNVALGYGVFEGSFSGLSLIQDTALMIALRIMQELCGTTWKPDALHFSHRRPAQPEHYEQLTGAPCYFDSLNTELLFPAEVLTRPLFHGGPGLATTASVVTRARDQTWTERVQAASYALLLSGKCSQASIAQRLGLSMRSLNRQLELEEPRYCAIVDGARYAISKRLLKETDLSVKTVASLLSYTDAGSFSRAFRRWSGLPPAEWRALRQHRQQALSQSC